MKLMARQTIRRILGVLIVAGAVCSAGTVQAETRGSSRNAPRNDQSPVTGPFVPSSDVADIIRRHQKLPKLPKPTENNVTPADILYLQEGVDLDHQVQAAPETVVTVNLLRILNESEVGQETVQFRDQLAVQRTEQTNAAEARIKTAKRDLVLYAHDAAKVEALRDQIAGDQETIKRVQEEHNSYIANTLTPVFVNMTKIAVMKIAQQHNLAAVVAASGERREALSPRVIDVTDLAISNMTSESFNPGEGSQQVSSGKLPQTMGTQALQEENRRHEAFMDQLRHDEKQKEERKRDEKRRDEQYRQRVQEQKRQDELREERRREELRAEDRRSEIRQGQERREIERQQQRLADQRLEEQRRQQRLEDQRRDDQRRYDSYRR